MKHTGTSSRGHGAPLLLLLAVLGGLFAMHGLGTHGATHHSSVAAEISPTTVASALPHPAEHAAPASMLDDSAMTGYAALCLAFLGALALLSCRRSPVGMAALLPLPRPVPSLTWPTAARRDRDPPSLFELSINRC